MNQRISAALRHWPTSIIMSLGTVAERDTGNVFREILGHPSTDNETLGHSRTPLNPSSSTEL